jgi:hypothetical protein
MNRNKIRERIFAEIFRMLNDIEGMSPISRKKLRNKEITVSI